MKRLLKLTFMFVSYGLSYLIDKHITSPIFKRSGTTPCSCYKSDKIHYKCTHIFKATRTVIKCAKSIVTNHYLNKPKDETTYFAGRLTCGRVKLILLDLILQLINRNDMFLSSVYVESTRRR